MNRRTCHRSRSAYLLIAAIVMLLAACGRPSFTTEPSLVSLTMADDNGLTMAEDSSLIFEEGSTVEVVIGLTPAPSSSVEVMLQIDPAPGSYRVEGDGIGPGSPTGGILPVSVALDARNSMRTMSIVANADDNIDLDRLSVSVVAGSGYRRPPSPEILAFTITDVPAASLGEPSSTTLTEGAGSSGRQAEIAVQLDRIPTEEVMVVVEVTQSDPVIEGDTTYAEVTYGLDYEVTSGEAAGIMFDDDDEGTLRPREVRLLFAGVTQRRTLLLSVTEDVDGLSETLSLRLLDGAGYQVVGMERSLSVSDNEPTITELRWLYGLMENIAIFENGGDTSGGALPLWQIKGNGTLAMGTIVHFLVSDDSTIEVGDVGQDRVATQLVCTPTLNKGDTGFIKVLQDLNLRDDAQILYPGGSFMYPVNSPELAEEIEASGQLYDLCFNPDADNDNEVLEIIFLPGDGYQLPPDGISLTILSNDDGM